MWEPRDWVALLVAATVAACMVIVLTWPAWAPESFKMSDSAGEHIKELLLVLIGALSGYIAGERDG